MHTLLKANELIWNEEASKAFEDIKVCLAKTTMLSHPKLGAPTSIMSDAPNTAVGEVLQQFVDGVGHPITYFSHKLSSAETKYSTFDRELLAIYLAIKRFRHFIEGREFHVWTDISLSHSHLLLILIVTHLVKHVNLTLYHNSLLISDMGKVLTIQ